MKKEADRLGFIVILIVAVVTIGSLLGISSDLIDQTVQWLISIFTGSIFSLARARLRW